MARARPLRTPAHWRAPTRCSTRRCGVPACCGWARWMRCSTRRKHFRVRASGSANVSRSSPMAAAPACWPPTPERGVDAWMQLVDYHRNQAALLQLPDAQPHDIRPDRAAAIEVLDDALACGREWLDAAQTMAVLAAYGIPIVPTRKVRDVEE